MGALPPGTPAAPEAAWSQPAQRSTSGLRRVQIHARRGGAVAALSPPSAAAASPRRVEKRRVARWHRHGSPEQAGPLECGRPARLPLNLGTAAGHSPHPAQPPPQRTPPNSPPPTRCPSAPGPWEHHLLTPYPESAPTCPAAHSIFSSAGHDAQVGGTLPGELKGGGGTRAGQPTNQDGAGQQIWPLLILDFPALQNWEKYISVV